MAWVKIDDQFADHPKIAQAGPLGLAVYVAGLCYSARYLTDGFIPHASAERFAGSSPELRANLVELSLWNETNGGYLIHDYLNYNPPAARVKAEREAAKARMNQNRGPKRQFAGSSGEVQPNNDGTSGEVQPPRTRTPIKSSTTNVVEDASPQARTYEANGGTYQAGKLADGTTKKARAMQYITENIKDNPESLALWGRIVASYCAQWSSKSYTIMVNDYYLNGRVPGESRSNGNGTKPHQQNALAVLKAAESRPYHNPTADELAAQQAEWDAAEAATRAAFAGRRATVPDVQG